MVLWRLAGGAAAAPQPSERPWEAPLLRGQRAAPKQPTPVPFVNIDDGALIDEMQRRARRKREVSPAPARRGVGIEIERVISITAE